jgi:hypothetical protein
MSNIITWYFSYRKLSAMILTALLIATCVITAWISYSVSYVPTLNQQFNMLNLLYDPPWTRIGPYLVGMVTGWIVVELNGKLPLKKVIITSVFYCWSIFAFLLYFCIFNTVENIFDCPVNYFPSLKIQEKSYNLLNKLFIIF